MENWSINKLTHYPAPLAFYTQLGLFDRYPKGVYTWGMSKVKVPHFAKASRGKQSSKIKAQITRRLAIAEGQMKALRRMVDEEKYCIDVLTQAEALKKAISGAEELVLENHIKTHVVEMVRSGKANKAAQEITNFYKLIR